MKRISKQKNNSAGIEMDINMDNINTRNSEENIMFNTKSFYKTRIKSDKTKNEHVFSGEVPVSEAVIEKALQGNDSDILCTSLLQTSRISSVINSESLQTNKKRNCNQSRNINYNESIHLDFSSSEYDLDMFSDDSDEEYIIEKSTSTPKMRKTDNDKLIKNKKPRPRKLGNTTNSQQSVVLSNIDDKENRVSQPGETTTQSSGGHSTDNNSSGIIIGESGVNEKVKYKKTTRVRSRNPKKWLKNDRKAKRNAGKAYEYKRKSDNRLVAKPARKIGPPCKCKKKCYVKIGPEGIKSIFEGQWGLCDYNLQTADLQRKIDFVPTKRKRNSDQEKESRVSGTYNYNLHYQEKDYKVCKEAFLNIHDIGKQRVYEAHKKQTNSGNTIKDQRGQNAVHNRLPEEVVNCVHEHIQKLPVRSSHYTREKNPNRQYLDFPVKTYMPWLYQRYKEWMKREKLNIPIVLQSYYNYIYRNYYNIHSLNPRTDTCDTCAHYRASISDAKGKSKDCTQLEASFKQHTDKADVAYDQLKYATLIEKWDPTEWIIICMDLQQTMSCPKTSQGAAYYKRKLNVYNFLICDVQKKEPYFFVWEEFTAHRGSCEIYSCLYKWLQIYVFPRGSPRPMKLRIIADNCGGQNKNNNMCLALLRLVHQQLFHRIELGFLLPGHSYMPCDTHFGTIEKNLRRCEEIPSPDIYCDRIKCSRKNPYPVYKMKQEDFLDIDVFTQKGPNRLAYIRPTKDKVFQTATLIVMKHTFPKGYILKKNFYDADKDGNKVCVHPPLTDENAFNLGGVALKQKYSTELRIDPLKIRDLESIRGGLVHAGSWIDDLANRQKDLTSPFNENPVGEDNENHDEGENGDWVVARDPLDIDNIYEVEKARRQDPNLESPRKS